MDTISKDHADGRRHRRRHSDEFKAEAVAACMQRGVSMAAVAMARGVNANLLRRWVRDVEMSPRGQAVADRPVASLGPAKPTFVPLTVATPPPAALPDIRIEVQRGLMSITVNWPATAASACATWLRELLR